jgi:hypothetical protein
MIKEIIGLINVDNSNPFSYMPTMIQAAGVVYKYKTHSDIVLDRMLVVQSIKNIRK